jgi:hypothetical protein
VKVRFSLSYPRPSPEQSLVDPDNVRLGVSVSECP